MRRLDINNTIVLRRTKRDTCLNQLASILDKDIFNEYQALINRVREASMSSAPDNLKAKWVKNLSSQPPTGAQISLLARGPEFAVVPIYSSKGEYIVAVEEMP